MIFIHFLRPFIKSDNFDPQKHPLNFITTRDKIMIPNHFILPILKIEKLYPLKPPPEIIWSPGTKSWYPVTLYNHSSYRTNFWILLLYYAQNNIIPKFTLLQKQNPLKLQNNGDFRGKYRPFFVYPYIYSTWSNFQP